MAKATQPKTVTFYDADAFYAWLSALRDNKAAKLINNRLRHLAEGNEGDCASVGDGVFELRLHIGPGLRVYFAKSGNTIIIVLHGGTKRRQTADIEKAKKIWQEIRNEI